MQVPGTCGERQVEGYLSIKDGGLLKIDGWASSSNTLLMLRWKYPKHFAGVVPIVPKILDSRLPSCIGLRIAASRAPLSRLL